MWYLLLRSPFYWQEDRGSQRRNHLPSHLASRWQSQDARYRDCTVTHCSDCLSTSGLSLASQLWASFLPPSNRWLRKGRGRAANSRTYRIPGTIIGHCPDPSSDATTLTSQSDTAFHSPPRRTFHCCSSFTSVFNSPSLPWSSSHPT